MLLEVLSATTALSLIFVSEYMLGSKVLICSSGRPSEAGHDPSINLKTKKRLRYYSLLGKSANFTVNLYKEYTSLKSRELEELPCFQVMSWQPS